MDFTDKVRQYLKLQDTKKVLLVIGPVNFDKTVGVLQAVNDANTIMIVPYNRNITKGIKVLDILQASDAANIIIERYECIDDTTGELTDYLALLPASGKKVIIIGKDSASIRDQCYKEFMHVVEVCIDNDEG